MLTLKEANLQDAQNPVCFLLMRMSPVSVYALYIFLFQ